jgi:hypothetical protein
MFMPFLQKHLAVSDINEMRDIEETFKRLFCELKVSMA